MNVLALIPARSGSKGIPNKNIRIVGGKPLIAWSISHARDAKSVSRVIVSTDDPRYAAIAREYGAETPFIRPPEFSGDMATDLDVFRHALAWLKDHEGYEPELCVHLRPTCPVRQPEMIDAMVQLLAGRSDLDAVRTISPVQHSPYKMWRRGADGLINPLLNLPGIEEPWNEPRQRLPEVWIQNANIDVVRSRVIMEKNSMTGRSIFGYPDPEFHDIDTLAELERVGLKLAAHHVAEAGADVERILCFDIDGVIAMKTPGNDYRKARPCTEVVARIRRLYDAGYRIILFTARGSMTGLDWREVTEAQMKAWSVPYHELHFGKPAAKFYIDDRALREDELDTIDGGMRI